MKKGYFVLLLLALSCLCGYLLSKASLIGKAGMTFVYKEYAFMKTWWQGAAVVFAIWLLLFFAQGAVQQRLKKSTARLLHIGCIIAAVIGLYFTYQDFRHTLSHRLLGERFHLGGYLFWVGWVLISIFFLSGNRIKEGKAPLAANTHGA